VSGEAESPTGSSRPDPALIAVLVRPTTD